MQFNLYIQRVDMDNMIRRIDKKNELSILSASLHKYFQPCAIRLVAKHFFGKEIIG